MIKKLLFTLMVIALTACTTQNTPSNELSESNNKIVEIESKLEETLEKNDTLITEIATLEEKINFSIPGHVSFKDFIKANVEILQKLEGDDLYPYYIIGTMEDRDHNTPLLITVDDASRYEEFEVGKSYDLDIYVEVVIQPDDNSARFMYSLIEVIPQ